MTEAAHTPVMLDEVLAAIAPRDGAIYVDGTFGAGGYSRAILDSARCRVCGIDRDPAAAPAAAALGKRYADRFLFVAGRFGDMAALLAERGIEEVDGVALDVGVSSMQLDSAERGFSFRVPTVRSTCACRRPGGPPRTWSTRSPRAGSQRSSGTMARSAAPGGSPGPSSKRAGKRGSTGPPRSPASCVARSAGPAAAGATASIPRPAPFRRFAST